jgi:hypothetical protein
MSEIVERIMADIHERMTFEADALGLEMVAQIQKDISIDVEYTDGGVIRSTRGQAPRREFRNLYNSIDHRVTTTGDGVTLQVVSGGELAPYAQELEAEFDRPYMTPNKERFKPDFGDRLHGAALGK